MPRYRSRDRRRDDRDGGGGRRSRSRSWRRDGSATLLKRFLRYEVPGVVIDDIPDLNLLQYLDQTGGFYPTDMMPTNIVANLFEDREVAEVVDYGFEVMQSGRGDDRRTFVRVARKVWDQMDPIDLKPTLSSEERDRLEERYSQWADAFRESARKFVGID